MSFSKNGDNNNCIVSMLTIIRQEDEKRSQYRRQQTPKDFARENVRKLREMQRNRKVRNDSSGPVRAVCPLEYKDRMNVTSELSGYTDEEITKMPETQTCKRPSTITTLKMSTRALTVGRRSRSLERSKPNCGGASVEPVKSTGATITADGLPKSETQQSQNCENGDKSSNGTCHKPRVPKLFLADGENLRPPSTKQAKGKDFNHEHTRNKKLPLQRSSSVSRLTSKSTSPIQIPPSYQLGVIPKYLLKRQKQWQEELERKQRETPDLTAPPGHQLLSEENRLETLHLLDEKQHNLLQQVAALPICNETLRIRRLKEDLEKKLLENDEAIKIFSHSKVYIKNDD